MAELRRSETSFKRHGSSGLVWNDKFHSGLINEENQTRQATSERYESAGITGELRQSQSVGSISMLERSQSEGASPYRTVKVASPSKDPDSPQPTCWFCGIFGKPGVGTSKSNPKSKKCR